MSTAHGNPRYWEASPLTRGFQTFVTLTFKLMSKPYRLGLLIANPYRLGFALDISHFAHGNPRYWEASPLTRGFQTFVLREKHIECSSLKSERQVMTRHMLQDIALKKPCYIIATWLDMVYSQGEY